eukprot:TRINITY_DN3594_c0_g1_i1.p1 TRINITY_DN3594_c0_g1~~TRINITY_DN3594_c0_g1_i1.p1  ORF type:complete len:245 (-),score=32.12 TRINITY_DN3594_c0_g1_i1:433-1167(-)
MPALTLADMTPLPENGPLRIGRWSSIDSVCTFPSRMGSTDAATPAMLFPATPTPMASPFLPGQFGFDFEQFAAPSCSPVAAAHLPVLSEASTASSSTASSPDLASLKAAPIHQVAGVPPAPLLPHSDLAADTAVALHAAYVATQLHQYANGIQQASLPTLPSSGSALHSYGKCSPCAWFWKAKGCRSGLECTFCHLCPQDELKKRKRAKVDAIRCGMLEPAIRQVYAGVEEKAYPTLKLSNILG